jgi:hypothetical protein
MRYHLLSFQNIYSVECREWNCVKKTALFDHREFVVFSNGVNEMKVVGSHRPRSRFESFLVTFFAEKKGKSVVKRVNLFRILKKSLKGIDSGSRPE